MKEIVAKRDVPEMPKDIRIQYANRKFSTNERTKIKDLSEKGVRKIVRDVQSGKCQSLYLTPNENGEIEPGFLQLEDANGEGRIFLQICADERERTAWACFDLAYLDSDEESPIETSDGQSVISMRTTMRDHDLAAKCVEWYIRTLEPYPGMDWLKLTW